MPIKPPSTEAMAVARKLNRAKVNLIIARLYDDAQDSVKHGSRADSESIYAHLLLQEIEVLY